MTDDCRPVGRDRWRCEEQACSVCGSTEKLLLEVAFYSYSEDKWMCPDPMCWECYSSKKESQE